MAGKARVHELAKELGVTSKEVLARLNEQGEFVKSASSTVEAPVARRLRESFGGPKPAAREGQDAPATVQPSSRPRPSSRPAPKPAAPPVVQETAPPRSARGTCSRPRRHRRPRRRAAPAAARGRCRRPLRRASAGPRPDPGSASGPDPRGAPKPAARTPRVGNNPFSSQQPVERPAPRPQGPAPAAPVPAVRVPAAAPGPAPPPATCRPVRTARGRAPAADPVRAVDLGPAPAAVAPEQVAGGRPGGGGGGNYRGGGAGGPGGGGGGAPAGGVQVVSAAVPVAAVAVAVPVSAAARQVPSVVPAAQPKRGRKSKRAKRAEYENMQAPVVGGVRLPHGNGETIRLARGASLVGLRREDRRQPGRAGAGAVQPRRDGHRHPVGR